MPVTLERVAEVFGRKKPEQEEGFAEKWLGRFEGAVPEGKSSTEVLREMRRSSYGKFGGD